MNTSALKKERDKKYYSENKEKINARNRKYKLDNKQKVNKKRKEQERTVNGLTARIFNHQKKSSKNRGHSAPSYSLDELRKWIIAQNNFNGLYVAWVESGFNSSLTPSCDRLDDYKPYSLDNLRLVTWSENCKRVHSDIKKGINNKLSKSIIQLTREGILISEYYSGRQAARETGIRSAIISKCCRGILKTAGGFVWSFA